MKLLVVVLLSMVNASFGQRSNLDLEGEAEFYPSLTPDERCPDSCPSSCPTRPKCPLGVSVIMDGCGCCKTCARQQNETCTSHDLCDKHRGLYCDLATGTCKVTPGRSCNVAGKWYENGETMQPTCRIKCWCIDGSMGCMPTCKTPKVSSAIGCDYPRLIRTKENCCGVWNCTTDDRPPPKQYKAKETVRVRKGDCLVQTTPWSECSKTCGFGISDRVSNDNDACKLRKDSRLCNIRSCNDPELKRKKNRSCRKTFFKKGRVQFSLNGCRSTTTYRPKYCGMCDKPDRCCKPIEDKTINVTFRCGASKRRRSNAADESLVQPSTFVRKIMWITKCTCDATCPHENDIFAFSFRGYGRDTS